MEGKAPDKRNASVLEEVWQSGKRSKEAAGARSRGAEKIGWWIDGSKILLYYFSFILG